MHRRILNLCLSLVLLALSSTASAGRLTVPVDVGVGPAYYFGPGPLFDGTYGHFGLKISVAAILDKRTIKQNIKRVPPRYRQMARQMDEVRIGPSIFIPDALIISPKHGGTGMFGVTWRPIGMNVPLMEAPFKLTAGVGAILTYAFIYSDTMAASSTHFLRPGLDAGLRLEIPLSETVLISTGCFAQGYIPQQIGSLGLPDLSDPQVLNESIWLMVQSFLMLHVRFPYTVNL
jgi:hypothetical protein